jgi:enamine deaminase RidA (YjgF/YER057c/UK114 family)
VVKGVKGKLVLTGVVLLSVAMLAAEKDGRKIQRINPAALSAPNGYSHVVVTQGGRTIYVSGQVPLTKDGKLVGDGKMEAQTRQVFENLKAALAGVGAELKDLVKINIYTTDASQLGAIRKVRNEYLPGDLPASTFMEVKALFRPEVMIEIDGIAVAK